LATVKNLAISGGALVRLTVILKAKRISDGRFRGVLGFQVLMNFLRGTQRLRRAALSSSAA
jgi:hypothetical protein